jgi:hypothetical protein
MKNLVGFERALGCANHITIGEAFLKERSTVFSCNADRGHTWMEDGACSSFESNSSFEYPHLPKQGGGTLDWGRYPRGPSGSTNADLCTLRIAPTEEHGWMVAENREREEALVYVWEREAFPWLMTWEENYHNQAKPWSGRTLTYVTTPAVNYQLAVQIVVWMISVWVLMC